MTLVRATLTIEAWVGLHPIAKTVRFLSYQGGQLSTHTNFMYISYQKSVFLRVHL